MSGTIIRIFFYTDLPEFCDDSLPIRQAIEIISFLLDYLHTLMSLLNTLSG